MLTIRELPNRRILAAANNFHDAAILLLRVNSLTVPSVVNAVLALELYLKCLNADIHFDGESVKECGAVVYEIVNVFANVKGHEPHKLFEALPQGARQFLNDSFSKRFPLKDKNLESVLKNYQGVFVGWRYVFEGNTKPLNLSELFEILSFLKTSTTEVVP